MQPQKSLTDKQKYALKNNSQSHKTNTKLRIGKLNDLRRELINYEEKIREFITAKKN